MLTTDLLETVHRNTFETEQLGRLPQEVLNALYEIDALRVMVPKEYGGLEWPLPEIVHFFEDLAQADGNVGWVVNLVAGANMFSGYLDENTARSVFSDAKVCCAGSGAPSGKAVKVSGGYRLTGRWKYASGSAHATHFTANAYLYDRQGVPIENERKQKMLSFIFETQYVQIYDTWHTTGLCATSSNEFSVDDIFVPEDQAFSLLTPSKQASGALYRFPFNVLAVLNMAVMPVGMGMHFIDLYNSLLESKKPLNENVVLKENEIIKQLTKQAIPPFLVAREDMYSTLETIWTRYVNKDDVSLNLLDDLTDRARIAAEKARRMLFLLYPVCGMNMVFPTSHLNKVWRDMSVASQHYLLAPQNFDISSS